MNDEDTKSPFYKKSYIIYGFSLDFFLLMI
jgi:hypothetical protein